MKGLRHISPYIPGEQPTGENLIKLNTNENAYPPSPHIKQVMETFDYSDLRHYSSLDNHSLREAIGKKEGINPDYISLGNGSDDVLAIAFQSFFQSDKPVIFPDITYGFYKIWCDLFRIPYKEIALETDFTFNLENLPTDIGGIVLANPNAPTGLVKPLKDIEALLKKFSDTVIIVDEAYISFGGESAISLVDKYPNLYVTRTFSKDSALAGIRLGYGVGGETLTSVVNAVKNSYNPYSVNSLTEKVGLTAVLDVDYYKKTIQKIINTREWFTKELSKLGFTTIKSSTNFVFTTHEKKSATELQDYLKQNNIYVRHFPGNSRIDNYLRISIGTQEEMEMVRDELGKYLTLN